MPLSLVVPAFKSPIPEHPKFSRPKALSNLPADASFTFCLLGHSANPTCITLHPSTIPNRPTSSQSPLPRDALLDYTAPPSLVLSICTRVLPLLKPSPLANLHSSLHPVPTTNTPNGGQPARRGTQRRPGAPSRLVSLPSPGTHGSFPSPVHRACGAGASARGDRGAASPRSRRGRSTGAAAPASARGAPGAGDISSQLPRERSRGEGVRAVPLGAWLG